MWKWLWHEERFNSGPITKHFFDSKEGVDAVDNGTWPYYPNAAGNRWIDLVKGDWNSTFELNVDGPIDLETELYFGDYEIVQKDENGEVLHTDTFTLSQTQECSWSANNMVSGDFDSSSDMASWQLTGPNFSGAQTYQLVNFDAYAGDAIRHYRSTAGQVMGSRI